ncbi:hypothetical protein N9Y42_08775 [Mariniblastus sp.]|nr:hypothetical protein [Mariniblastus sp.]
MEITTYERTLQWVGDMQCPSCQKLSPAWRSSGMSNCFPHFYCDCCSNVIHRQCDQELVWQNKSQALLDEIAATLPDCPCGGRFSTDGNPKCKHCNTEMPHSQTPVARLHDPNMIVVDGACVFSDVREPYQVKIKP